MQESTLTTADACEVAKIHRDRLNEAVARGDYPCVPPTRAGAARRFDAAGTVALCVFGLFVSRGITPSAAGRLACEVKSLLDRDPDLDRALIVWRGGIRVEDVVPYSDEALRHFFEQLQPPKVSEWKRAYEAKILGTSTAADDEVLGRAHFPPKSVEILPLASFRGLFNFAVLGASAAPAEGR